jgi:hypothetical protein
MKGAECVQSAVRYLGIEVDDALEMAEQTEAEAVRPVSGWSLTDPLRTFDATLSSDR